MTDDLEREVRAALEAESLATAGGTSRVVAALVPVVVRLIEAHRARAERAEAERDRYEDRLHRANSECHRQNRRAEVAEAAVARVRRALDDELANLADDGARLSHSVVRRIEAALIGTETTR